MAFLLRRCRVSVSRADGRFPTKATGAQSAHLVPHHSVNHQTYDVSSSGEGTKCLD